MVGFLLFGSAIFPAQAAFTSLYIFGDGVSTTTNNPFAGQYYYGLRRSNGRVWVELLAQQLGLTNNYWYSNNSSIHVSYTNLSASSTNWSYSSNNWSYWGDYSSNLVQNVNNFTTLTNATNALFVVWVIDADFVYDIANYGPYTSNNIAIWTNAINLSLTNHYKAITNLYAKGARTLIMPNAADITEIPAYNIMAATNKSFIRQRIIDFNTAFTTTLMNRIQTSCPGITIYVPDIFTLLNNVLTNAAAYGLTNALDNGLSIDALDDPSLSDLSLNGPGANYIFWDDEDPTARFHSVIAGVVQQLISPAQITNFTVLNGSNQLDVANVPIGLNGLVLGCTNLSAPSWTTNATFVSSNATQTVFVPASGSPQMFYQLYFPYTWTWP
jgi:phospholipase/lecithinase/hemolysin